jgi:nucleoside-diphosphate-sugar epimerase
MANIFVTGANGFVGTALCNSLRLREINFVPAVRYATIPGEVSIGEISENSNWENLLVGCDVVVHLAARVHVMKASKPNSLSDFRLANVDSTLNLARQAMSAGVRRFVFVSSIKVNGETTSKKPFSPFDIPNPVDDYGISKCEAEIALSKFAKHTGLELVIVRPPLVYGPGVRANFLRLLQFVHAGLPLPLSAIRNKRSMVAVENLVDLLIVCCTHPAAARNTFCVSDDADLSTPDLLRMLAKAMGKPVRLFPLPTSAVSFIGTLTGRSHEASRLLDSLQVDITSTKSLLGWHPVISVQDAIDKTVADFLAGYYPSNS